MDTALQPFPSIAQQIEKMGERRYTAHLKKKEMAVAESFGDELSLLIDTADLRKVSYD